MTAQTISTTLPPSFNGLDGLPLTGGSVYVGEPGVDSRQFQASVFYDSAMTVPASQPLRTTRGFLFRNGTPTNIWLPDGVYSLMVFDELDRLVLYVPSWNTTASAVTIRDPAVDRFVTDGIQTAFTLSVAPGNENSTNAFLNNTYVQKDAYSVAGTVMTFAVAPAAGVLEVNTETSPEYAAVVGSLAALVASASGFASSAAASAASAAASLAAAQAIASGSLVHSQEFTGVGPFTIAGAFTGFTDAVINGQVVGLSVFSLAGATASYIGTAFPLTVASKIRLYYV